MPKILGVDLGTNSIGLAVRDTDKGPDPSDQFIYYKSVIFKAGAKDKEQSFAAQRRERRSIRRRYQAIKYRKWATLELLIEYNMCPLSIEGLDKWRKYDKSKGLFRQYPADEQEFIKWIRMDFGEEGPRMTPYELRAQLMTKQFDFENKTDRLKFGRAIYHIAQRRGFKSSKGETADSQLLEENSEFSFDENDKSNELKSSELASSEKLTKYMEEHNLPTAGCALNHINTYGIADCNGNIQTIRVRGSEFQAIRALYKDEIRKIFEFQKGLDTSSELFKRLMSQKKGEGTIFYKRPLRKGNVGRCILEPSKKRCPIGHPEFEHFRALSFLNNIKYRESVEDSWKELTIDQRNCILSKLFYRVKSYFPFEDIRKWIQSNIVYSVELAYKPESKGTINYPDDTTVSGCPVTARLRNLLGEDWKNFTFTPSKEKVDKETGEVKTVEYDAYDIWHLCFDADDSETLEEFGTKVLCFDNEQNKKFIALWKAIDTEYSNLSTKAIRKIVPFLEIGYKYSDAVMMAKLPDVFKDNWSTEKDNIISIFQKAHQEFAKNIIVIKIANKLIYNYKTRSIEIDDEMFAYKDSTYTLSESDFDDIEKAALTELGKKVWESYDYEHKQHILDEVANLYQNFLRSSKKPYYPMPKLTDVITTSISKAYGINNDLLSKSLYHHSMIQKYQPSSDGSLGSPATDSIRNPMVMRVLHTLRRAINSMLEQNIIDSSTRIVVETTREINDANWRAAIKSYQDKRKEENEQYKNIIEDLIAHSEFAGKGENDITDEDINKIRLFVDQTNQELVPIDKFAPKKNKPASEDTLRSFDRLESKLLFEIKKKGNKQIERYRLWKEQNCRCMYTGKTINISTLFDGNMWQIEHTIPRSKSFDDSLANKTICDRYFNTNIKRNQIPTELSNYSEIEERIRPWKEKVQSIKNNIKYWKDKTRKLQDKDQKDNAIRQRHMWELELEYWSKKVETFTLTEFSPSFRNSQLVDTSIIAKYAFHFLKSVFNKVDMQKGITTSVFREIMGIGHKDRSLHSHHAIDAIVLTMIPPSAKRDRIIETIFEIRENKNLSIDTSELLSQLDCLKQECGIRPLVALKQYVEDNIIVNHITKDKTFCATSKRIRKKSNAHNNKEMFARGDSFRGSLHKDTFYGVIRQPKMENNTPVMKDGKFVYDKNNSEVVVKRVPIKDILDSEKFDIIIDPYVRRAIKDTYKSRIDAKISKAEASSLPIWMTGKNQSINGNCERKEVRFDKNGHPIAPIRHVRCKAKGGRGFLKPESAIQLKEQTYKSERQLIHLADRNHKELYRVQNDDNYACLYCEKEQKGSISREFEIISNIDVVLNKLSSYSDLKQYALQRAENINSHLKCIIRKGTRVLLWKNSPEELLDCDSTTISRRLYVVYKFNQSGDSIYVYIRHHLDSTTKEHDEASEFNPNVFSSYLHLAKSNFKCLIEGIDFEIDSIGNIIFKNR